MTESGPDDEPSVNAAAATDTETVDEAVSPPDTTEDSERQAPTVRHSPNDPLFYL
ncbi:hypothetical protein ACQP1G_03455 [Nocardia sp. CA-107356]|uniref:hypothetical protein n=1 Tax=Nocardia sp. CA-107356 TaxID=3239972 RepID=UPI003D8D5E1D